MLTGSAKQILESDQAIRVATFIEGAEVTGYAEAARTKNIFSQSGDLQKKIGFWVSVVTEMARQMDQLFGPAESVCVTHKGLRMVTVPISGRRSLGLSLDRSADPDKMILKIMTKFDLNYSHTHKTGFRKGFSGGNLPVLAATAGVAAVETLVARPSTHHDHATIVARRCI
ncbi:hypothetical protein E6H11_02100 [Candidatus Bathyarchaeota archaeon]|nr:MAG: hypothetical protein E6H11_02100 [Candidatus Bathyarchaeota archaeon]